MPDETNKPRQPGEPSTNKPAPAEVPSTVAPPPPAKAAQKSIEE
jgi:hypothetical protein